MQGDAKNIGSPPSMSESKLSVEGKTAGGAEAKKADPYDENTTPEWSENPGTPSAAPSQTITLSAGYICDGCGLKCIEFRWHCMDCPDFDLCGECYDNQDSVGVENGTHKMDHTMEKMDVNPGADCDGQTLDIGDLLAPPKNEGLVHKLMHFVDTAMNDMEPFFTECIDVFEQDWNELHNEGVYSFRDALIDNHTLIYLNLASCGVADEVKITIFRYILMIF